MKILHKVMLLILAAILITCAGILIITQNKCTSNLENEISFHLKTDNFEDIFIEIDISDEEARFNISEDSYILIEKIHSRTVDEKSILMTSTYKPISQGYNRYQAEIFFTTKIYLECSSQMQFLDCNLKSQCKPSDNPVAYESWPSFSQKLGNAKPLFSLKPVLYDYTFNSSLEYLYLQCSEKEKSFYLHNVFNSTVASNAKQQEQFIKSKYNIKSHSRPVTVVLLIIDNFSRLGLFRDMPNLVNFFNSELVSNISALSEKYMIYDFYGSNSISYQTLGNIVPMLYGISLKHAETKLESKSIEKEEDEIYFKNLQSTSSLWSYYKKLGFATMVSLEITNKIIPKIFGREILADHSPGSFWQLARDFAKYDDSSEDYVCLGNKFPHEHNLHYLTTYLKNYEGINRFAYTHLFLAHDNSGTRARLGDKDLVNFFKEILNFYDKKNEDIVLVFASDHGRAKGEYVSFESIGERYYPFQFLISNKEFIFKHNIHQALDQNSQRLVSRYDWYKTFINLAKSPYMTLSSSKDITLNASPNSVSLLTTIIPENRTCADIDLPNKSCLSKNFLDISPNTWRSSLSLSFFILTSVKKINESLNKLKIKEVSLDKVLRAQILEIETEGSLPLIHYLSSFTLKNFTSGVFMVHGSYAQKNKHASIKDRHKYSDSKIVSVIGKDGLKAESLKKLVTITRLDIVDSEIIKKRKFLPLSRNYIWAKKGTNCNLLCESLGFACISPMFFENFLSLMKETGYNVTYVGKRDSIEIEGNSMFVGEKDMCKDLYLAKVGVCHCCLLS